MQNKTKQLEQDEEPSLLDRLGTAILAPIAFNFGIVVIVSLISGSVRSPLLNPFRWLYGISASYLLLVSILLPAIAGFIMGMTKFTTLYGHFFYTNGDDEKSIPMTILVWAVLLLTAYIFSALRIPF
ncbi:hypothetical protein [Methylotenera sp. L2L1]|uniref:hypothetical protein n=1 Tax=Methylotenera sp. L2L1 TaxID=1502770 RepID=UPI00055EB8AE|nr:hypothetical protein [Methylotenera sp. L2L1]